MTHPLHADDDVGRIAGGMVAWALDFGVAVMRASRKGERAERAAALAEVFETWPKLARRMAELEAVAPASYANGYEADAQMQDVLEVIAARTAAP